eukprot:679306-Rhodomonas_salina.1
MEWIRSLASMRYTHASMLVPSPTRKYSPARRRLLAVSARPRAHALTHSRAHALTRSRAHAQRTTASARRSA